MALEICNIEGCGEVSNYGDGLTWGLCSKHYFEKKEGAGDSLQAAPSPISTPIPHPIIEGLTSIIMPVWINSYSLQHYTGNAIGSIHEHTDSTKTPYEIVLIDDASPIKFDKLVDYNVDKVVVNSENLGYTKSVNKGIRVSQGTYIVVMNNDVMVFDQWLEDFQEALQHLDLVMAYPMYGETFARAREAKRKRDKWLDKPIQESFSDFNDFSCIATTRKLLNEIGTFDEQFKQYSQDIDFFRRMEEADKKFASCKKINIFHIIGGSLNDSSAQVMNDDKAKLAEKWQENEKPKATDTQKRFIKTDKTGDQIFLVIGNRTHWIENPQVFEALGGSFDNVEKVENSDYDQMQPGEKITMENVSSYA